MPVTRAILAIVAFAFFAIRASAQEASGPACFTGSPERAAALAKARKGSGGCGVKCKGCGCRGGPGYRNKTGKCVSYQRLVAECGPPPYRRCTPECHPAPKDCPRKQ